MLTIDVESSGVNGSRRVEVFKELKHRSAELARVGLTRMINAELDDEVTGELGRLPRSPRVSSGEREMRWACHRCGGRRAQDFERDGHYSRDLGTLQGEVGPLQMPMLECRVCGGSADIEFAALPKHKHLWLDIDEEVLFSYGAQEALRHIAERVGRQMGWPVSASSVQRRVHALGSALAEWRERACPEPPDVLMVDGIWFTVLQPTKERFVDSTGRNRPQQRKVKRVAIIALGLWSTTEQREILDFEIADAEDEDTVVALLNRLHLRGITEAHVKLIASDGAGGIAAAIETVYPTVARQRCVFHKLKNVGDKLQDKTHRRPILEAAAWIYEANTVKEAEARLEQFTTQWRSKEPEAVASLHLDFDASVAYLLPLDIQDPRRYRTTNHIEGGVQRRLRVTLDHATAFHSTTGAEAAFFLAILRLNTHQRGQPWVRQTTGLLEKLYKP